ncbi:hypothetical protein [Stenotrophomonas maltophilia]|uniref:Transmembrane protein n=1 Tax=Stenotrophomonas maltophilia TaxID=40324 RepID=A0AAJ2WIX2_STEMA|nr:hypothetical protein [Stenotrophomonas maltophilia]MDZ5764116.1 hypothetical protein [Stenotrophomonas maltophilia]
MSRKGERPGAGDSISMVLEIASLIVGPVAISFIKLARKSPALALAVAVTVVSAIAAFALTLDGLDRKRAQEAEAKRLESATYSRQLENLQSAEQSLTQLLNFVESQKSSLKLTQDALESMKAELASTSAEQTRLRRLAETDRKAIEGFLSVQQEQARKDVWTERMYGFGFGILASIVASALLKLANYLMGRLASRRSI